MTNTAAGGGSSVRPSETGSSVSGKWWETPQGNFWGQTLDDAIEHAIYRGWITTDRAFCSWWAEQGVHSEEATSQPAGISRGSDGGSEERGSQKDRYGKEVVPEYDGTTPMREYRRRVKLFESVSGISPQYRGGRLLERLSGLAWKAAETLDISEIANENGVSILLDHLESELEPLEYMKTFQVLTHFYNTFKRQRGEQMTEYDTSFRIQCDKLREVGSAIEGTTKAWWFLHKAGISDETRQKVVSAAGGTYDYQRLRQALVAIIPDVNRGSAAESASNPSGFPNNRRVWQKNGKQGTSHRVNQVTDENEKVGEDPGEGIEDDGSIGASDLEQEAEVLITHAARKRAEVDKARGYSTVPSKSGSRETPDQRAKRIEELKKRLPCSACKAKGVIAYGHWHSDQECPQNQKKESSSFVVGQDDEGDDDAEHDDLEQAFHVGMVGQNLGNAQRQSQVLLAADRMREESKCLALADTCCARTVVGQKWLTSHLKVFESESELFLCIREHEPFRFGAGPRVYSTWCIFLPLLKRDGKEIWVRCSIVEQDVPLLLSRAALKEMGAVVDLVNSSIQLTEASLTLPLETTEMGLVGFRFMTGDKNKIGKPMSSEKFSQIMTENEVTINELGGCPAEVVVIDMQTSETKKDRGPRYKEGSGGACVCQTWMHESEAEPAGIDHDQVSSQEQPDDDQETESCDEPFGSKSQPRCAPDLDLDDQHVGSAAHQGRARRSSPADHQARSEGTAEHEIGAAQVDILQPETQEDPRLARGMEEGRQTESPDALYRPRGGLLWQTSKLAWNKDRLIVELTQYVADVELGEDGSEKECAPLVPDCPTCGIQMIEKTNRMDGSTFFGCIRYPICKSTLPYTINKQPTAVMMKAQEDKEKKQYQDWLKKRGSLKNAVLDGGEEMDGDVRRRAVRTSQSRASMSGYSGSSASWQEIQVEEGQKVTVELSAEDIQILKVAKAKSKGN